MESRFDEVTKVLAEGIPRREALWRLGGLFAGAVLAALGWGNKTRADNAASECAHFCNEHFPGGDERTACKRACRKCGGPSRLCFGPPGTVPVCCTDGLKCCCGTCIQVGGVCCNGKCCPEPDTCCQIPGAVPIAICTDLSSDPTNCGQCGRECIITTGGATINGVCCHRECCFPPNICCPTATGGLVCTAACNGQCCPPGLICCPNAAGVLV